MLWLILAGILAISALLAAAILPLFRSQAPVGARLVPGRLEADEGPILITDYSRSRWARLVEAVEKRGVSLDDTAADAVANRLLLAGFQQPYAVRAFVLMRTGLMAGLGIAGFLAERASGQPLTNTLFVSLLAASVGLYGPNMAVNTIANRRQREILNGFPDTLDLMLICVEAGLGIDQSFTRVGQEITETHPLLAELLAIVSLELRAGRTRSEALKTLSRRTGLPELTAFVTLLNQAEKLGSSIGQALRVYAAEMRETRRLKAEERAARLPVLLSVPIILFLLPATVGVVMLPAVISLKAHFGSGGVASSAANK